MVRAGYKQTEVGVIPEDWCVQKLPDVIWYQEGPGLRKWQFTQKGLKVINITNLSYSGDLDLDKTERHISWEEFEKVYKHFAIDENDFLMASSGNSYCKSSIVKESDLPLLMNTSVIRFKPINQMTHGYMTVFLKSKYFKDQIDLLITGGAQPNFGPFHLDKVNIAIPSNCDEQKMVAKALLDVDGLIVALEKQIAKKRDIKTATMQQLLTGKKRLPGFGEGKGYKQTELGLIPEDWWARRLVSIAQIATGSTPPTNNADNYGSDFLFVSPVDLGNSKIILNTAKKLSKKGFSISRIFPKHSILFTCIGSTIGKMGIAGTTLTSNQQINAVFPSDEIQSEYLYYQLLNIVPIIKSSASEQAVPLINKSKFGESLIISPVDQVEQKAIAEILSAMDKELNTLETKLTKTKAIKQGMMQELLTGRTRLI